MSEQVSTPGEDSQDVAYEAAYRKARGRMANTFLGKSMLTLGVMASLAVGHHVSSRELPQDWKIVEDVGEGVVAGLLALLPRRMGQAERRHATNAAIIQARRISKAQELGADSPEWATERVPLGLWGRAYSLPGDAVLGPDLDGSAFDPAMSERQQTTYTTDAGEITVVWQRPPQEQ